jgi:hypothetical protein
MTGRAEFLGDVERCRRHDSQMPLADLPTRTLMQHQVLVLARHADTLAQIEQAHVQASPTITVLEKAKMPGGDIEVGQDAHR